MSIRRVVPLVKSEHLEESREFYTDFLGLTLAMDLGHIMTYVSPINPTAQISMLRDDGNEAGPQVGIEVADVAEVYQRAVARGLNIIYPLTDEPWGVRRFFVVDPNGVILNVMSHLPQPESPK
ncbi:MAG TPA: VOC family protein [Bryobacteraceae bacterium]|nr:VOC family protein [Bryobacteraceae bacterium]